MSCTKTSPMALVTKQPITSCTVTLESRAAPTCVSAWFRVVLADPPFFFCCPLWFPSVGILQPSKLPFSPKQKNKMLTDTGVSTIPACCSHPLNPILVRPLTLFFFSFSTSLLSPPFSTEQKATLHQFRSFSLKCMCTVIDLSPSFPLSLLPLLPSWYGNSGELRTKEKEHRRKKESEGRKKEYRCNMKGVK